MAYTGTGVTTPYTDTYVYSQDGDPLELLRQAQGASTATPYWYALDGQGNVAALATQSGSVVDSYSYDQWGRLLGSSESVPQQLRYKEYWYDNELQWYWLSVRAYDPALGRFLQPDPSELEGLFSYVYAADNPADSADPSGLTVTQPAPSGCLETSGDFFECNVRAGSTQWNNEITSGGAAPVAGVAGTQVASAMPNTCGDAAAVCQVDAKVERGQGADLTAEYIDRVIQAIKNIWPNIVTRGKWNKSPFRNV